MASERSVLRLAAFLTMDTDTESVNQVPLSNLMWSVLSLLPVILYFKFENIISNILQIFSFEYITGT